jgi:hypothetical protein
MIYKIAISNQKPPALNAPVGVMMVMVMVMAMVMMILPQRVGISWRW